MSEILFLTPLTEALGFQSEQKLVYNSDSGEIWVKRMWACMHMHEQTHAHHTHTQSHRWNSRTGKRIEVLALVYEQYGIVFRRGLVTDLQPWSEPWSPINSFLTPIINLTLKSSRSYMFQDQGEYTLGMRTKHTKFSQ